MMKILSLIWSTWKKIANFILESFFKVVLFVFYFTVMLPFALVFMLVDKETFNPGWQSSPASNGDEQY